MHPQELKSIIGSGLLSFPLTDFDAQGAFDAAGRHRFSVGADTNAIGQDRSTQGSLSQLLGSGLAQVGVFGLYALAASGWGGMPLHLVDADLATGALRRLDVEGFAADGEGPGIVGMAARHRGEPGAEIAGMARHHAEIGRADTRCGRCGQRVLVRGSACSENVPVPFVAGDAVGDSGFNDQEFFALFGDRKHGERDG